MLTFRIAQRKDAGLIGQLARDIWTRHYSQMLSYDQIEYMLEKMYAPPVIEKELGEGVIWEIVETDRQPIGFISCTCYREEMKLNKLYILPEFHGRGFGQKALRHVIDMAGEKKIPRVFLTVNKNNEKAMRAYEKTGFKRTDASVSDIGNGFVMDDYIYTYHLE